LQSAFQFLFLKNMASLSIMLMVIVKETELVRIFCVWKSWSSYSGRLVILPCLGVSSIMINIFYEAKDNELVFFILFSQTTPLIKSRTNSIQNMGFLWLHDELEFWVEILCIVKKTSLVNNYNIIYIYFLDLYNHFLKK
jgi:hypothetical protein